MRAATAGVVPAKGVYIVVHQIVAHGDVIQALMALGLHPVTIVIN